MLWDLVWEKQLCPDLYMEPMHAVSLFQIIVGFTWLQGSWGCGAPQSQTKTYNHMEMVSGEVV